MATKYVDYSATYDGDGTAPNQAAGAGLTGAYNTLSGHIGSAGDVYWLRRVTTTAVAVSLAFNVDNVKYIGWPQASDDYYASRPADGISQGWDSDANAYAQVFSSNGNAFQVSGGTLQEFHRIHFRSNNSTDSTYTFYSSVYATFKDLYVTHEYTSGNNVRAINLGYGQYWRCKAKCNSASSAYTGAWFLANGSFTAWLYQCEGEASSGDAHGFCFYGDAGSSTHYLTVIDSIFRGGGSGRGLFTYGGSSSNYVIYGRKIFSNCDFYGGTGRAVELAPSGTNGRANYGLIFDRCAVKSGSGMNFYCEYAAAHEHPWYFKEFTQTIVSSDYAIYVRNGPSCMYVENATFFAGNTTGDVYSEGPIYFKTAAFQHPTVEIASPNNFRAGYINNYAGSVGYFKFITDKAIITSDVTYRTGGETFSLKILPSAAVATNVVDMPLGWIGTPGRETIFALCPAGSRTITIYGAYKLWGATPPNKRDLWMEGSYYAAASAVVFNFSTKDMNSAALDSDASVWNGDTSLTAFSISVNVTVGQTCLVPLRILFSKYVAGGAYIYIDPKPSVV